MNGMYLIPANSKKSMLYFGLFNTVDLIILGVALAITFMAILVVPMDNTFAMILAVLPGIVGVFLVFPIPNYHNTRTFLRAMYLFLTKNQNYVWKGWCFEDGDSQK